MIRAICRCIWEIFLGGSARSDIRHEAQPALHAQAKKPLGPQQLLDDVIYETAHHLDMENLYKMLFLDRSLYKMILPLVWQVVDTRTSVAPYGYIDKLNKALRLNPKRALLIKRWVIGTNAFPTSCYPEPPTAMANTVVELAKKKHLINLTKFWWFWDWGPLEQVWTALRSA
ncbi:hypothetical protein P691DRAFT_31752 [Macrolepiota fuliginosa MF-IS2]|uniref:Uncharacterized protein n=1 Tax=Macrolepiota fuliginosa MF-IS2 TaxID=1400762 RepID=A0A9P6C1N5_9AGAR|nr:hypothetical protein P691DRAFT_31752 [Macrolepiota fuliginosa MF-IS2]